MLDPTDATLRVYEERADRYAAASAREVSAEVAVLLDALLAKLARDSRVLELGTGPGREAAYLEERGVGVDRTDATSAFVERLRLQGREARLLDVRHGDLGDRTTPYSPTPCSCTCPARRWGVPWPRASRRYVPVGSWQSP